MSHSAGTIPSQSVIHSLGVVIATLGRREIVEQTIYSLALRKSLPSVVIVVGAGKNDLPDLSPKLPFQIQLIVAPARGLSLARNHGFRVLPASIKFVTFIDDDMEVHDDYCAEVESVFQSAPEVAGFSGCIIANGNIDRLAARQALDAHQIPSGMPVFGFYPKRWPGFYGCAMNIRRCVLNLEQFDEQLLLGMEDCEMGFRVSRHGSVGGSARCPAVHLAVRSGRISEVGIGYTQIINPLYFIRKGIGFPRWSTYWKTVVKTPLVNLFFWRLPSFDKNRSLADRKGRFRGNVMALCDVVRGKIEPKNLIRKTGKTTNTESGKMDPELR